MFFIYVILEVILTLLNSSKALEKVNALIKEILYLMHLWYHVLPCSCTIPVVEFSNICFKVLYGVADSNTHCSIRYGPEKIDISCIKLQVDWSLVQRQFVNAAVELILMVEDID